MPTFVIGAFRQAFPEFSDTVKYPDAMVNFWATVAQNQVRQCVWKNMWLQGVSLYVAHEITLAAQNVKISKTGGVPGTFGGVPNNKTVGGGSVAYDSANTSEKDAGYWNLTNYGKQFFRFVKLFGAGAIQLNGSAFPPNIQSQNFE